VPGADESKVSPERLRALVLCFSHPHYLEAAERFVAVLRDAGVDVVFRPSPGHRKKDVLEVLANVRFDLVAYFGHGGPDGWHGYFGGFRLEDFRGIRRQKLFISTSCRGLEFAEGRAEPFGARMVESGLAECFVGSSISTDTSIGRIYMQEFARAMVRDGGRVEALHGMAIAAVQATGLAAGLESLDGMRIFGDGSISMGWPEDGMDRLADPPGVKRNLRDPE